MQLTAVFRKKIRFAAFAIFLMIPVFAQPIESNQCHCDYHFSEVWVWEYFALDGTHGEIAIYRDPKTDNWLFTQEAFGISGEMYNWIVGKPDGTYLLCSVDEFGKETISEEQVDVFVNKQLPQRYKPTKSKKIFNRNSLGFPEIKARGYSLTYEKTDDSTTMFIADSKVDFSSVYFFNRLNSEAKLPIFFPVDFPPNAMLLEEVTTINQKNLNVKFKMISHSEYCINASANKKND